MEVMFKRDDTRENYPPKNMGQQEDQQTLEASSTAQIPQRNNPGAEGQGKHSADFSITQIVIFSSYILLFHHSLYENMFL